MKHTFIIFFTVFAFAISVFAKEIKVLTIGNSFADSVFKYLPAVAKEESDCKLIIERANHGGCELSRHWRYISEEEVNPDVKNYRNKTTTLRAILQSQNWDVVTIQQASHDSWRPESFFPYAQNIFNYVKKYVPTAEVVIQQTWSYRSDDPRIMEGGKWNIDQTEMFKRLEQNYTNAAQILNVRVIPTGLCVQNARAMQEFPFVNYDHKLLRTLRYPDVPLQSGSIVGKCFWMKNKESGKMELRRDSIHLNERGEYMQACLWFGFLFEKDPISIKYIPNNIDNDDANFLRSVASKTLKEFKQPRDKK